jgi:uncharacterized protein YjbI with pentapeptide repeats
MLTPQTAAVRPRVVLPDGEGPVLLDDEVEERLDAGDRGVIALVGPSGCGKTTALAHLADRFAGDARIHLADSSTFSTLQITAVAETRLVVCALPRAGINYCRHRWKLAGWTRDEWIEYLLALYPDQCSSVMGRLQADPHAGQLGGSPELCSAVLDQLAGDDSIVDVKTALRHALEARLGHSTGRLGLRKWCLTSLVDSATADYEWTRGVASAANRLAAHRPVQILVAADHLVESMSSGHDLSLLAHRLPGDLIEETALGIRGDRKALSRLRAIVGAERQRTWQAMAASLLAAADVGWVPNSGRAPLLVGAQITGVRWPGVTLKDLDLTDANIGRADLTEARLRQVIAHRTNFRQSKLHGAQLVQFSSSKADFMAADLSYARAEEAVFHAARLVGANLEGALCCGANFTGADMSNARCQRGNFSKANFTRAVLTGADFSQANLTSANLFAQSLRRTDFTGANFTESYLKRCDLEYMRLPGCNFKNADLWGAHLTGSDMSGACFRLTNLRETGLAEIEWERADLRGADLTGATFHLGSSRSGLVDSFIASEGTRTGFYTDEYLEQGFKSPEEIRKANLRGADLRGAKVEDVDFYLVDLRDAIYTDEQADHFRRCRAILEARVE